MKVRVKFLVHLVMRTTNRTTRNVFDVRFTVLYFRVVIQGAADNTPRIAFKGAFKDLCKGAQKGSPEITLKGALQVALELHLFIQLSMHKTIQYDSVKGEIEVAFYAALEGASKISFLGALKTS